MVVAGEAVVGPAQLGLALVEAAAMLAVVRVVVAAVAARSMVAPLRQ